MSSFDKVVKLACKPKPAPPKAKYLDPIIAATYADDGAIHDVCRALAPRFREPNAIVVFKALLVLHTMIRSGATDNVLGYLSSTEVLRLRNVSTGQWEGYAAPQNLQHYAAYLDARIRAYRELKHDALRVQADVNRDMRVAHAVAADHARTGAGTGGGGGDGGTGGRKLRVMTVEKGLLRETKAVQRMLGALLECRFYHDNLDDELHLCALGMLVKDLLVLFQAVNEGVVNVLEHYFEMSRVDAGAALALYRAFCAQAERVAEYLAVAKKLQNLLNVPIPNLKHAPVSLAGALEEYLNDPNFEQNRIEYRANSALADAAAKSKSPTTSPQSATPGASSSSSTPAPAKEPETKAAPGQSGNANQALVDFFSAIEEEQPNMFDPRTGSPTTHYFQQQAAHNPFVQRQAALATGAGAPFAQPFAPFGVQAQLGGGGGALQPQHTAFPAFPGVGVFTPPPQQQQPFAPFQAPSPFQQPQATGFPLQTTGFPQPQTGFPQQQQTGFSQQQTGFPQQQTGLLQPQSGFLQQQTTGANPFRQSTLFPLATGQPLFGLGAGAFKPPAPAFQPAPFSFSPTAFSPASPATSTPVNTSAPARPASTPAGPASAPSLQHVAAHQTGSRNPFGAPRAPSPPPVPRAPTLQELARGAFGGAPGAGSGGAASISSVASSFAFGAGTGAGSAASPTASSVADSFASFSTGGATGTPATSTTGTPVASAAPGLPPLAPQTTGFAGLRAFKPTSSFGASLLESLPPVAPAAPAVPVAGSATGAGSGPGTAFGANGFGALGGQRTGLGAFGTGLSAQATGGPNPFRASVLSGGGAFGAGLPNGTGDRPQHQNGFATLI